MMDLVLFSSTWYSTNCWSPPLKMCTQIKKPCLKHYMGKEEWKDVGKGKMDYYYWAYSQLGFQKDNLMKQGLQRNTFMFKEARGVKVLVLSQGHKLNIVKALIKYVWKFAMDDKVLKFENSMASVYPC